MNKSKKLIQKKYKNILYGGIACLISLSLIPSVPVLAADESSPKEEVVYVNLGSNGDLEQTYVVNIVSDKNVVDYGDYSNITNLTSDDTINYKNGMITIENSSDTIYYEGVLNNANLPWNISLHYELDGKDITAEELAGQSGKLKIYMDITNNDKANAIFYDNYTLQATLKLDRNLCSNIVAEGATVANNGSSKQLNYTILSGNEKDFVISADVADFEMESISITGVNMNIPIDADIIDTSELTEKTGEITNAISSLTDGTTQLDDGTGQIKDGLSTVSEKYQLLMEGLTEIGSNSATLTDGSSQILSALNQIKDVLSSGKISKDNIKQLSTASASINLGIKQLTSGLSSMKTVVDTYKDTLASAGGIDQVLSTNNTAINSLQEEIDSLSTEYDALAEEEKNSEQGAKLNNQIQLFNNVVDVLSNDTAMIDSSNTLINKFDNCLDTENDSILSGTLKLQESYGTFNEGIQNLSSSLDSLVENMNTLKSSINTLCTKYEEFQNGLTTYTNGVNSVSQGSILLNDGVKQLATGSNELNIGADTLLDGMQEFQSQTLDIDVKIKDSIDEMVDKYSNNDFQVESFVSDKNTDVSSVQFVIKTASIEKVENKQVIEDVVETQTVWERFISLFDIL
ncbi:MAG: hypothetical protein ACERKN_18205 [Velocimicrobium sp.]